MYDPKKMVRIGIDIDKDSEFLKAVDDLCEKERWSRKKLAEVALETYIKMRMPRKEN